MCGVFGELCTKIRSEKYNRNIKIYVLDFGDITDRTKIHRAMY